MNATCSNKLGFLLGCVFLLAIALPGFAKEGSIVAVFNIEDRGSGLNPNVLVNLEDQIVVRLTQLGYHVVPRDQLRERLKQQKAESYRLCYDQSCQIELGRELAAQKSLSPMLVRIGDSCQLTIVLYDLRSSTTEKAANVRGVCTEESMINAVNVAVDELVRGQAPEPALEESTPRNFWSVGLSAGLVFPSLLLVGTKEPQDMYSQTGTGGIGILEAYLHYFSFAGGARIGFFGGPSRPDKDSYTITPSDNNFNILTLEGAVMLDLDLSYFFLRLGGSVGYGTVGGALVADYINQVKSSGSKSSRLGDLCVGAFLGASVPLYEHFSLLIEFGFIAIPNKDTGDPVDFPPILYLTTGVEFGM